MPTPFESAQLNLQLFDLRREPVLREARSWFLLDFHPETMAEFVTAIMGERNASIRMVLGYWDMAASLVTARCSGRSRRSSRFSRRCGLPSMSRRSAVTSRRSSWASRTPRPSWRAAVTGCAWPPPRGGRTGRYRAA